MMKRADRGRTYTEAVDDREAHSELDMEVLETLKDALETPDRDSSRSLRILRRWDESVRNCLNAEEEYIRKDEGTGKLVIEYLDVNRKTEYLYIDLKKGLAQVRIKLRSIGVMLKKMTPETPLSDAQYLEISKRLMDYKMLEAFKDFEEKWEAVLEGHKQLLEKLEERKKEFEKEEYSEHKADKVESKLKKGWSIWRILAFASAVAMGVVSVTVAHCLPHSGFVQVLAPAFCAMGFTFAGKWVPHSRKDQRAEKQAEAETDQEGQKRTEAEEKKRAEVKKDVHTMDKCTVVTTNRPEEAKLSERQLTVDQYIDLCLESKENLLEYVGEMNKGQESIIKRLDGLSTALETDSEELHERRESLISMMARYI